jgi:sec-independent protein translocase protein TatC
MDDDPVKSGESPPQSNGHAGHDAPAHEAPAQEVSTHHESGFPQEYFREPEVVYPSTAVATTSGSGGGALPPPKEEDEDEFDEEDEGMLRMSFMGHLEELRSRILRALMGFVAAFLATLIFASDLWKVVQSPAENALRQLGVDPPRLAQLAPMEAFSVVWVKVPLVAAIFLASPWIVYQVWAFVAPGLYKKERRLAAPFILVTAGLFITGGLFAYFVAFRFGLVFLLGIGRDINIQPVVSIAEYFDLFFNVVMGIALVFELPVVIFFLTLLRVASPSFLLRHSRYAILFIVVAAAIITPTPDFFNLTLFAVPMILLYFLGVFASYMLVLRRENRRFPWADFLKWVGVMVVLLAGGVAVAVLKYGYHFAGRWPFLVR